MLSLSGVAAYDHISRMSTSRWRVSKGCLAQRRIRASWCWGAGK